MAQAIRNSPSTIDIIHPSSDLSKTMFKQSRKHYAVQFMIILIVTAADCAAKGSSSKVNIASVLKSSTNVERLLLQKTNPMSCVFHNIDPPQPSPPGECVPPGTQHGRHLTLSKINYSKNALKVQKREKFFVSDFEFFTILQLVKLKY